MKMNKILASVIVLLSSAVLLSGCIKEVTPQGGSGTTGQKPGSFEDPTAAIPTILITNYANITGEHYEYGYPAMFGITDRMIGDMFPVAQNLPGGNQYYDRFQPWLYTQTVWLESGRAPASFVYRSYYAFIKMTNDVIGVATGVDNLSTALGIAKTFRALYYLDMARLYDPLVAEAPMKPSYETDLRAVQGLTVPLSIENMTLEQYEENPRMTREEIFTFILSDLDDAEGLLANFTPALKNIPSRAVVYGLKARAYLWLGGFTEGTGALPNGNAAYAEAARYARMAITAAGGTITSEAQWTDKTMGFNTVISSWMWAMIQSSGTVLNNLLSFSAHHSLDGLWGYGPLAQPGMPAANYARMAANDFRRKMVVGPDRNYAAMAPYINMTEEEFFDEFNIAPYAVFKFKPNGGEKRDFALGNVTSIPMMRIEEMYFIEAEATAHSDAASGKALLETFMANRAPGYVSPASSGDALIEEIIFQKRMEFWGEGICAYDMKRLNIGMQNGNPGTNAPSGGQFTTAGRAPWWNFVIPLGAVQQNRALLNKNNPNPNATVESLS
jgi:hypothetical protein